MAVPSLDRPFVVVLVVVVDMADPVTSQVVEKRLPVDSSSAVLVVAVDIPMATHSRSFQLVFVVVVEVDQVAVGTAVCTPFQDAHFHSVLVADILVAVAVEAVPGDVPGDVPAVEAPSSFVYLSVLLQMSGYIQCSCYKCLY